MANKNLFNNKVISNATCASPLASTVNKAGGIAYSREDKAVLAQYAMTGCLNGTYYDTDKNQLLTIMNLSEKVDSEFIAKLAVYSRKNGLMKDMPATLAATLSKRDPILLSKIFNQVIDNPKMLRTFTQIVRSGAIGRKSLGTRPKKLIQNYLESLTDEQLFKADIGNNPSLPDLIKMVHPKPTSASRSALYAYLLNKPYQEKDLNSIVNDYEHFKKNGSGHIPNVPFQMLTALPLTPDHWKQIASYATWNQVRMNLNTFARHGVFEDSSIVAKLAKKLSDKKQVLDSKVFPWQLYSAFKAAKSNIPVEISNALQDATEFSLENIPSFNGKVYVMVDVSGSMQSPISGYRGSVSSKITCVDAAAVFASAILIKNPNAEIIPFDTDVHVDTKINARDSIMSNTEKLASFGGGGTYCAKALKHVNNLKAKGDIVIYISDNESWTDNQDLSNSETFEEWKIFKDRNPNAKLVNIDIQPYKTSQVPDQNDILNIGGFSDQIFNVISKFIEKPNHNLWIEDIEKIQL
jgi:60 kDa SS-A/Ro ribonucleoprotein